MKQALVTGGARGIGLAISQKLAADGWKVFVLGSSPPERAAEAMATIDGGVYLRADLADIAAHDGVLDAVGALDLLVNNAGVAPRVRADMLETTPEDFDHVLNINLRGAFFLTQAVAKRMVARDAGGCIVNISSISAYVSSTNRPQYCISKAGVSMTTQLFADRLAAHGIGVYEIRPGIIESDMTSGVREKYDRLIFEENLLPIRRWGQGADVARVVAALAGGLLPYSTGEVINVDGGFHLRRL